MNTAFIIGLPFVQFIFENDTIDIAIAIDERTNAIRFLRDGTFQNRNHGSDATTSCKHYEMALILSRKFSCEIAQWFKYSNLITLLYLIRKPVAHQSIVHPFYHYGQV